MPPDRASTRQSWIHRLLRLIGWPTDTPVDLGRGHDALTPRGPYVQADSAVDVDEGTGGQAAMVGRVSAEGQPVIAIRVIYASQTGFAEQLARQTMQSLQYAGVVTSMVALDSLTPTDLAAGDAALFVVSTTGDGDAPDDALAFFTAHMQQAADLRHLRYGLLALGDSDYEDFCGFGHTLQRWLHASGAQPMFDLVEVDSEDEGALRRWQYHLATLTGAHDLPDWTAPRYQSWRLMERALLNPGSVGGPCYLLKLRGPLTSGSWQAGDVAEVGPCHGDGVVAAWLAAQALDGALTVKFGRERMPLAAALARSRLPASDEVAGMDESAVAASLQRLPHRDYSIASLPADGTLDLLVRQTRSADGVVGIGAGWLTDAAPLGTDIDLRVRSNDAFHVPRDDCPLIVIGNGTGMAALHALLQARVAAGRHRNWLLYGERQQAHDFPYRDDITRWLAAGQIERADFAWSRDQVQRIHVQQRLREAAAPLRQWIDAGAAVYVCGSLQGMAGGVDAVLRETLGDAGVEQLRAAGRYRRDVY